MNGSKTGLIRGALTLLRRRPAYFWRALRGYALFVISYYLRKLRPAPAGIVLGSNVRLQRNSCLMAERPSARISIGRDSIVYEFAKIESYGSGVVEIGEGSIIGEARIFSRCGIHIGARFLAAWNVFIQDFDSHPLSPEKRRRQVESMTARFRPRFGGSYVEPAPASAEPEEFPGEEIFIGNDVWLGANATVLKGARIGDGCMVAAGAVVTRGEYPSGSLIAGNPARVVKSLGAGETGEASSREVKERQAESCGAADR